MKITTTYVKNFTRRFAADNIAVLKDGSSVMILKDASRGSVGYYGSISGGFTVQAGIRQVGTDTGTNASITNNAVTPTFQLVLVDPAIWSLDTTRFSDLGMVVLIPESSRVLLFGVAGLAIGWQRRRWKEASMKA